MTGELSDKKIQILNDYYLNNANKLHTMVNKILSRFGGIYNKDLDDFYSLANTVFMDLIFKYDDNDGTQPFENFLYSCLLNKIKSEITRRNRKKNLINFTSISIDIPITENEELTLSDILMSEDNTEDEAIEKADNNTSMADIFLNSLSELQQKIIHMKLDGIDVQVIKKTLSLSDKQYRVQMSDITKFERIKVLYI